MRIGEFVALLNTTKDTVRHYENLNLIKPKWNNKIKDYGQEEILDFQVIIELKSFGLTLHDIQLMFELKEVFGCGDKQLLNQVFNQLTNHLDMLKQEEEEIHKRRLRLQDEVNKIREYL